MVIAKENRTKMKCALIYDFDGTLAKGNCVEHGLLENIKAGESSEFWAEVKEIAKANDGDEILSYLYLLLKKDEQQKTSELTKEKLQKYGAEIELLPGVEKWFENINRYASSNGIALCHYIISSGLDEMIKGTKIGNEFEQIYACKYFYNNEGKPSWPIQAINYTTKTQFIFRINKGIRNSWDNELINKFVEPKDRDIPFDRMIYFGDGDTDIPSMKMIKLQGGNSIAVFDEEKWRDKKTPRKIEKLISEERATYVVPENYEEGYQLDVTVRGILKLIKRKNS